MSVDPKLDDAMRRALEPAIDRIICAFTEWRQITLPVLNERIRAEIERLREADQ